MNPLLLKSHIATQFTPCHINSFRSILKTQNNSSNHQQALIGNINQNTLLSWNIDQNTMLSWKTNRIQSIQCTRQNYPGASKIVNQHAASERG